MRQAEQGGLAVEIFFNGQQHVITIDAQGQIQSFTPAAGAYLGYLRQDLQTGQAHIIGIGREVEPGKLALLFQPFERLGADQCALKIRASGWRCRKRWPKPWTEHSAWRAGSNRDRLIQVVINLISNAVKFTDAGSASC